MHLRLNAILAILFAAVIMVAEAIRSYGMNRHWSAWIDDYLLGIFLLIAAFRVFMNKWNGQLLLAAAWASTAGLLYGSFFSKWTNPSGDFKSNIANEYLISIIGIGLAVSLLAMLWTVSSKPKIAFFKNEHKLS